MSSKEKGDRLPGLTHASPRQLHRAAQQWFLEQSNAPKPFNHLPYLLGEAASAVVNIAGFAEGFHAIPDSLPFNLHNPDFLTQNQTLDLAVGGLALLIGTGVAISHIANHHAYRLGLRR